MINRLFYIAFMIFFLIGCKPTYPPTSGGKTADYWAETLQKPDVELRRKAATKLGPLLLLEEPAMSALLGALKDVDPEVRSAAARSLGIYSGPRAEEALPALREVQQRDADSKARKVAAKAIEKLSSAH